MSKTTEFSATPELLKQLYEYSIIKNYEAGDVILRRKRKNSFYPYRYQRKHKSNAYRRRR